MRNRVFSFALLLLVVLVTAVGCKSGSIEGTWTGKAPMGTDTASLVLKGDKTFEMTVGSAKTPMASGTYEVKDKEVKMTATKVMGMDIPANSQTAETGTVSDDGKTLNVKGTTLTKQ